jgi:hypothetical protein
MVKPPTVGGLLSFREQGRPRVDNMITIFGGFSQFLAKQCVFLKYQCCDQLFKNLALF